MTKNFFDFRIAILTVCAFNFASANAAGECSTKNTKTTIKVFGDQKTQIFDSKKNEVVEVIPEFTNDMGDFVQPSLTVKAEVSPTSLGCKLTSKLKVIVKVVGTHAIHVPKEKLKSLSKMSVLATQEKEISSMSELSQLTFEKIPFEAPLNALPEDVVFNKIKIQIFLQSAKDKNPVLTAEKELQAYIEHGGD